MNISHRVVVRIIDTELEVSFKDVSNLLQIRNLRSREVMGFANVSDNKRPNDIIYVKVVFVNCKGLYKMYAIVTVI